MAITVQMQFESAVTEMYQDAFVGSSIENGVTIIRLRSWRRPLPSAAVRRQSASRPKVQRVQRLRGLSFQALHGFILNNTKIVHSYNYLIFLTFLQDIEIKSISIRL